MLLLIAICLLPCASEADSRLKVVTLDAPPMVIDRNGELSGLALEVTVEGLKRAGYEADIILAPWKRAVYMARHGDADALFFAVFNEKRTLYFHYPETPLFLIDLVLIKRVESNIIIRKNRKGLDKLVLGMGRGFAYGPKVEEFIRQAAFQSVDETSSNAINFSKLIDGRIDLLVADKALARHLMEQPWATGMTDYVRDEKGEIAVLDTHKAYLVFSRKRQSEATAKRFSQALDSMKADGTYNAILQKYQ